MSERPVRDRPIRILIVEDEWFIASECEDMLLDADYEVVGLAADEPEALELMERTGPDLVLMDVKLARQSDGVEVAKAIRKKWQTAIIFTTAHNDPLTRRRGEAARPAGWINKPYTSQSLLEAVAKAVNRRG